MQRINDLLDTWEKRWSAINKTKKYTADNETHMCLQTEANALLRCMEELKESVREPDNYWYCAECLCSTHPGEVYCGYCSNVKS
jgi:hypothetical protein